MIGLRPNRVHDRVCLDRQRWLTFDRHRDNRPLARGAADGVDDALAGEAVLQALELVERGGTVLLFGMVEPDTVIPLPLFNIMHNGITITSSYANTREDAMVALKLIQERRVRVAEMITHRLGLAETGLGFKLVSRARDCLKVIIHPQR